MITTFWMAFWKCNPETGSARRCAIPFSHFGINGLKVTNWIGSRMIEKAEEQTKRRVWKVCVSCCQNNPPNRDLSSNPPSPCIKAEQFNTKKSPQGLNPDPPDRTQHYQYPPPFFAQVQNTLRSYRSTPHQHRLLRLRRAFVSPMVASYFNGVRSHQCENDRLQSQKQTLSWLNPFILPHPARK